MNNILCNDISYAPSKVVCVGKNYDAHIAEMGGAGRPDEPTIFIKPNSAIAYRPKEIFIPEELGLLHHEAELCCLVEEGGKITGFAVGLDLTLRDLQSEAKKSGAPWALAKGFDNAAVFGEFVSANVVPDPAGLDISLLINGEIKQKSNTRGMIFSPQQILDYSSRFMTIEPGDVFMCGTPEGVGPVHGGDVVIAEIEGLPKLEIAVNR